MTQPNYLIILKELEKAGIGTYINLSPLLMTMLPSVDNKDYCQVEFAKKLLNSISEALIDNNYIKLYPNSQQQIGSGNTTNGFIWLDTYKYEATITAYGLTHLAELRNHELVEKVNKSVIDTNKATRTNFCRQTIISAVTILIAALTGWITWLTYQKTKVSDDLEKCLNTLEKHMQQPIKDTIQDNHQKNLKPTFQKKNDSS